METGIGALRTEKALGWLTANYRPRCIISAGFSGALIDGLRVGDVVLASEVADLYGGRWLAGWPGKAASSWPRKRLLSVPRIVARAEEKLHLERVHGAVAVDMETAAVARFCHRQEIPFGCVRAISDDVHTSLSPRLVSLLGGGRISPLRILSALIVSPRLAKELWRLAQDTRRAARQLAGALDQLMITASAPGGCPPR
jgi:hypothetical protein